MIKDKVMTIWDMVSGKTRNVKNIHVVLYETGKVVEFTVIGKQREWPMFIEYSIFKETNPSVELKDI